MMEPTVNMAEQSAQDHGEDYPDFFDAAEKVPLELQDEVASFKRDINASLDESSLIEATGEESAIYRFQDRPVLMLRMRLENGAAVYIPVNEIGSSYRHVNLLVGKKRKISISTLATVGENDEEGNPLYVAIGSIRQAEFVIGGQLYSEFENNPEDVQGRTFYGVITDVIDNPEHQMIFIDYHGMAIPMYAGDFYYRSYAVPLHTVAKVGNQVHFKITNIERIKYEEMDSVKEDHDRGRITPRGYLYMIRTTALPFRESPDSKVKRLFDRRATFIAHVSNYDPIKGILVEIAPGWFIKGILPSNAPYQPSKMDQLAHTPVAVRINELDYKTRRGNCTILTFPRGVAQSPNQRF